MSVITHVFTRLPRVSLHFKPRISAAITIRRRHSLSNDTARMSALQFIHGVRRKPSTPTFNFLSCLQFLQVLDSRVGQLRFGVFVGVDSQGLDFFS